MRIPYGRQQVDEADVAAVVAALRSDWLTQGPVLPEFERAFAARHAVPHAIAVTNATAALHLACLALGVGRGDVVWTSPNSFVASANCALYCGATVDFVDVDPLTRNLSVERLERKLEAAAAAHRLPKVVVPVDFAGLPCDLRELRALADRFGFRILEDASHATGAAYLGAPVGSAWADATVFSFHPVKVLTTAEGGMVVTRDAALAQRLRELRAHGIVRDPARFEDPPEGPWWYEQHALGFNARMTELQAALGLSQLARLDTMRAARERLASRYDRLLAGLPLRRPARLPDRASAWHLYCVEIEPEPDVSRASVVAALHAAGIGAAVHYIPIHRQPFWRRRGFRAGDFPAAEAYYRRAVTLPLYPALTDAEQDEVVGTLAAALDAPASGAGAGRGRRGPGAAIAREASP